MIQYSYQYCELVNNKKIRLIRLTKLSSVSNMKSLLFSFYLITIDYQNYDYLKKIYWIQNPNKKRCNDYRYSFLKIRYEMAVTNLILEQNDIKVYIYMPKICGIFLKILKPIVLP